MRSTVAIVTTLLFLQSVSWAEPKGALDANSNPAGDAINPKTVVYISPVGNDSWSGRLAEPDSEGKDGPLATLDAARLKVRELKTRGLDQAVEVQIRGGEYELRETVVFSPQDSGAKENPITYKAYPGEKPVFSGGVKVSNWKLCENDPEGMSPEAKGKLWVAEIPRETDKEWRIKTLYSRGKLLGRSNSEGGRFAKKKNRTFDWNSHGRGVLPKVPDREKLLPPFDRDVYYSDNDMRDWPDPADIEIIVKDRGWSVNILPLERIDTEKKMAIYAVDPTYQPTDRYYRLENAIDYLDKPGEWVWNTQEGRLYLWPDRDIEEMEIVAPYLQEFVRVEGVEDGPVVSHLVFEGLTFRHGLRDTLVEGDIGLQHDWEMYDKGNAILRFRHAEDCVVRQCEFSQSSGTGIRLDLHCQRIAVLSNLLEHLGGSGVVLSGYGPGTKDENKFNEVSDNYIHHIGELYWHSPAIFIAQSGNNQITHNTISDLPYNGIVVSGCRPHEFFLTKYIPSRRAWMSSIRIEECQPFVDQARRQERPVMVEHFIPLLHAKENVIRMNEITRTLLTLHDGNAVYFSAMGENNVVDHNFLHHNYDVAGTIRLDDNPTYTIMKNNVIMYSNTGIAPKGSCEISNNFLLEVDCFMRGEVRLNYPDITLENPVETDRNIFWPSVEPREENSGYYLSGKGKTDVPFHEKLRLMDNSIYFTRNTEKNFVPKAELGVDLRTGKKVIPGVDPVKLLYADPMFDEAAMKQKIFRFLPGSPAEKLGIEPIDLSEVGSSLAVTAETVPSFVAAPSTETGVVFRDDFSDGNRDGWYLTYDDEFNDLSVDNGSLRLSDTNTESDFCGGVAGFPAVDMSIEGAKLTLTLDFYNYETYPRERAVTIGLYNSMGTPVTADVEDQGAGADDYGWLMFTARSSGNLHRLIENNGRGISTQAGLATRDSSTDSPYGKAGEWFGYTLEIENVNGDFQVTQTTVGSTETRVLSYRDTSPLKTFDEIGITSRAGIDFAIDNVEVSYSIP